mgnify:CR=1 FL=1
MSTQSTIARGDLRAYEESVRLATPELVERLRDHPAGVWIRNSSVAAGLILLGFGVYFSFRTVAEFVSGTWIP